MPSFAIFLRFDENYCIELPSINVKNIYFFNSVYTYFKKNTISVDFKEVIRKCEVLNDFSFFGGIFPIF